MFGRIAAFEFRYQLKNPVLWVAAIFFFLLSYGVLASDERLGGGRRQHQGERPFSLTIIRSSSPCSTCSLRPLSSPTSSCATSIPALRPDRPLDPDHQVRLSVRPFPRRLPGCGTGLPRHPARRLARLADALGRCRDRRAQPAFLLFRALSDAGTAQPAGDLGDLLRLGDRDPLDDGDLSRRRRLPDPLDSGQCRARQPAGAARNRGADRAVRPWRVRRGQPLLDAGRAQQPAAHARRRFVVEPADLARRGARRAGGRFLLLSLLRPRRFEAPPQPRATGSPGRGRVDHAGRDCRRASTFAGRRRRASHHPHRLRNAPGVPQPGLLRADGWGCLASGGLWLVSELFGTPPIRSPLP